MAKEEPITCGADLNQVRIHKETSVNNVTGHDLSGDLPF